MQESNLSFLDINSITDEYGNNYNFCLLLFKSKLVQPPLKQTHGLLWNKTHS